VENFNDGTSSDIHQKALHNVELVEVPPHMMLVPHNYQLKAAKQIDFACRSIFKGILVGDGMDLGKTLQAVLSMWKQRDEPGLSLVVCPATLCEQWAACVTGAFEEV
jgi:SNF2 family DNA or RNA helicase